MAINRAPKQWSLTKVETITTFEAWKQNLEYTLSLDPNFARFMVNGVTWGKKTNAEPLRGQIPDAEPVPERNRLTAEQKVTHLELLLGQIANYAPVISRNTIVRSSTSLPNIWQAIRLHYGFQSTGSHFLDFDSIKLNGDERPEDLFQRLSAFIDDNLLKQNGGITHYGDAPAQDEEISPSLENLVVLTWLRLINPGLPRLVKQRYGTELRSRTLASLKPEISQALDSLLDELRSSQDVRCLRAPFQPSSNSQRKPPSRPGSTKAMFKVCPLCKTGGRNSNHFLSTCTFLPESDKKFLSRARHVIGIDEDSHTDDSESEEPHNQPSSTRRVNVKQSPFFKAFYEHHPIRLTIDTGAETNMIKASIAKYIGAKISKSSQTALQADGVTPLNVLGEIHITLSRSHTNLHLDALVVEELDVDVLAGTPFMIINDISVRPAKHHIVLGDGTSIHYGEARGSDTTHHAVRRTHTLRAPSTHTIIWPGDFLELELPETFSPDTVCAIEPRVDSPSNSKLKPWLSPSMLEAVGGKIRIVNQSQEPQSLRRNEHFCQVVPTFAMTEPIQYTTVPPPKHRNITTCTTLPVTQLDPDSLLSPEVRKKFSALHEEFSEVFKADIPGYNGAAGPFQAVVNMGPVQPPQRKGRIPQYARNKLVELQAKFDELEECGVFHKPEDLGVVVEYLNPSFLVKKSNGGFRLVTAFADVGRYCKPQPSLMPDVDSTLRSIACWKHIIVTDLTSAFYQIPLSKESQKYCGVATPFRGVRVYSRCAMGMPGSETALEELMCRVLGQLLEEGVIAKLADDLYCGGNTSDELLYNWRRVLEALHGCNLRLSAKKTVVSPRSTTILGWVWSNGNISASPHRVSTLATCKTPETVRGLRSFIGTVKVLSRVLPGCAMLIAPLEDAIIGQVSQDKVKWTDSLRASFSHAQTSLSSNKCITLPRPSDQLWIVTDGSVKQRGIGSTLYITRDNKLRLAGFYSAKLRKHQVTWLPCEIEALGIAAAVKHFSPHIIQSQHQACILTDSKPCVQAAEKLCRGEFSASPRVTTFLTSVSRYHVSVRHLAGSANVPSDFASRNAPDCDDPTCQICAFISRTEDSVVRNVSVGDIMEGNAKAPFTSRNAWLSTQAECPDLRRVHAHLKQGTRPSKK